MEQTGSAIRYRTMPLIPLRGISVFPGMLLTFDIGRSGSMAALDAAMAGDQLAFLTAQQDISVEEPGPDDLCVIGAVCRIRQTLKVPDAGISKVMVEGIARGFLQQVTARRPFMMAQVEQLEPMEEPRTKIKAEALIRQCMGLLSEYAEYSGDETETVMKLIADSEDPGFVADTVAQGIYMRHSQKQAVLEELRPVRRIALVNRMLRRELDILQIEQSLHETTAEQLSRTQRDMFLREQMKAIRAELGEEPDDADDAEDYRRAIFALGLAEESEQRLLKELSRMLRQPYGSAESAVIRSWLDACLELPWNTETDDVLDLALARRALDEDHFGLDKVKERVTEFLAVRRLAPDRKGSILCLVGPPGTGKTSIAMSIARATNRKLARISLGGVHDEAEIRGHRKTYVGAMPGRIMAAVRQAGSRNPVLVLDEIDKLGSDYRGDPSAALLEALDPEQNATFRDHYLELPFDLSDVFFITTANTTDTIPRALLDRMEVIELPGYTDEEKLQIVRSHLLPRQRSRHGLNGNQLRLNDAAIRELIALYTREAGVRRLERCLATICRKTAAELVSGKIRSRRLSAGMLEPLLGPPKYVDSGRYTGSAVALVHGLAWTGAGGEVLDAEAARMPGSGKLELTGNLGDVMKESAKAALTWIRSESASLEIEDRVFREEDIHIHFPEGAVPKDGPSAGVTVCTALVSLLTGKPVRQDLAMTGEITLRGRVMPIGGLREKTMAALRAGIRTVVIPRENLPDLEDIDPAVRAALEFVPASDIREVLSAALGEDRP